MEQTFKRLWNKPIPIITRKCGGTITFGATCKAILNGLGFVLVLGLIGMGMLVWMALRMGTL